MCKDIRCLITNKRLEVDEWYWYSWELDAPISAPGMAELENRRQDPDDDFARMLWQEWEWTREIGYPDI